MQVASINLNCPDEALLKELKAGDTVLLSGIAYTARDAAHKELFRLLDSGSPLPFELKGSAIYYAGPTPKSPGRVIGSFGPTTSGRMDPYTPKLLDLGVRFIIGKGDRDKLTHEAFKRNNAVYFCAVGGAGALYSQCVEEVKETAFQHLGCESVKRLVVKDFPVFVGIDLQGNSIFAD